MKRILMLAAMVLGLALPASAAGSVAMTVKGLANGVVKYTITWTADGSGDVNANTLRLENGRIIQAQFVPGTGGSTPTALYDVVLNDSKSTDLLQTAGANLSATVTKLSVFYPPALEDDTLTLVVSAAGATKAGTVVIWVQR